VKYTVCVDFDGVIHREENFVSPDVIHGPPVPGAIGWLENLQRKFDVVVLSTRAESPAGKIAIERWLTARGLGGIRATAVKVPALLYVDDRAWRFTGANFPSPEDIHRALPWHKERDAGGRVKV
jgi:hypothetical protein